MQELTSILLAHGRRYPQMEPRDAVKLIYQNEFGGGHLIRDEAACLRYLRREYDSVPQVEDRPLLEPIGNGIFRVMLCALDAAGYTPEQLGRDFIRSAAVHRGDMTCFLEKLELLRELTRNGQMPFPTHELESFLAQYGEAGYPAVSHSGRYRDAYHPAYRIVRDACLSISPDPE